LWGFDAVVHYQAIKDEKKKVTMEDWDNTNKNGTVKKCRQLYKAVLLSVVGGHLRMPHSLM